MSRQKIEIQLPNGYKLVAERNYDPNYPYEIYVGVLTENNAWIQDLAIVRSPYHFEEDKPIFESDKFEVLVYSDENNEDYTHKFTIGQWNDASDNTGYEPDPFDYEEHGLFSPQDCDHDDPPRICYGCKFEKECYGD